MFMQRQSYFWQEEQPPSGLFLSSGRLSIYVSDLKQPLSQKPALNYDLKRQVVRPWIKTLPVTYSLDRKNHISINLTARNDCTHNQQGYTVHM